MIFKIYGERNSGTTFLTQLLRINFKNITVYDNIYINKKEVFSWKHSEPSYKLKQNLPDVIDFIIFRDLESWLISMFKNPFHLSYDSPEKDFESFLTKKQKAETIHNTKWVDAITKQPISINDDNRSIFEIRYFKYNKTMDYFHNNKNIVLVNLSYLQNDENCKQFIHEIQKRFNLSITPAKLITKHTKENSKKKNRNYNIDIKKYNKIIEKCKNVKIENEIENLTFILKTE